jgi:hypothetical protein
MQEIAGSSDEISKIVKVIGEIAFLERRRRGGPRRPTKSAAGRGAPPGRPRTPSR